MYDYRILAARFVAPEQPEDESRCDRVFVNGLVLTCSIGVYEHERLAPQRVRLNVDLRVRRDRLPIDDDIANVLSYEDVINGVRKLVADRHINLVETLAEEIAELCLANPRVVVVRVKVEKLDVEPDAAGVGVEIERRPAPEAPTNVYLLPRRPRPVR